MASLALTEMCEMRPGGWSTSLFSIEKSDKDFPKGVSQRTDSRIRTMHGTGIASKSLDHECHR
jgi:hypothetical protein